MEAIATHVIDLSGEIAIAPHRFEEILDTGRNRAEVHTHIRITGDGTPILGQMLIVRKVQNLVTTVNVTHPTHPLKDVQNCLYGYILLKQLVS